MLVHTAESALHVGRVVVLGGGGFIGRAVLSQLARGGVEALCISSRELDLCEPLAGARLAAMLRDGDRLVVAAGIAPAKPERASIVERNARLATAIHHALVQRPAAQVVHLSSDAVYPDDAGLLSETSCAAPGRAYGMSHRVREAILRDACEDRLAVVRCTMIYGAGDPHSAYGPNRMLRTALDDATITLFGDGEDVRDYLSIADLARLILHILDRASVGIVNAASGEAVTARFVAEQISRGLDGRVRIERAPRSQPASERRFDPRVLRSAFPDWQPLPLAVGLAALVSAMRSRVSSPAPPL